MDNLSDFISEIVQHDKIKKVGLLDVYEEASANTSHSDGSAGMYYFNYIGMPYEDFLLDFYWVCGAISTSIPVLFFLLCLKSGNVELINVPAFC